MRIWSLHPKYLDPQGLVALWREGLLAKKVLEGKTKGYRYHPQLIRFKNETKTLDRINLYLHLVCDEADLRGYEFDRKKLMPRKNTRRKIKVNQEQIHFEWQHLLKKQFKRSRKFYLKCKNVEKPEAHPIFRITKGPIEDWEIQP